MDATQNSENKPARRIPLNLGIEYRKSYARESSDGVLMNISLTGAFLKTETARVIVGDKISVVLNVCGRIRKVPAKVVWTNEAGAGVLFLPFNNRDVQIVDDLMYFAESTRTEKRGVLDTIIKKVA